MMPYIQQQLLVSLAKQAKLVAAPHQPVVRVQKKHEDISHLNLRNQRRIKKLRDKKLMDSDLGNLLRDEVKEHVQTRNQLTAALKDAHHTISSHRNDLKKQETIKEIEAQLGIIKDIVAHMDDNVLKGAYEKKIALLQRVLNRKKYVVV